MNEIVKVRSEYPPTVALSELALEIPEPTGGWVNWLAAKGITVIPDDIGRDSVARHHAKRLLDEQREEQLRRAALARLQEKQAVEADQARRSQIWGGIRADQVPDGMTPTELMLASDPDRRPRRKSVAASFLDGDAMVMHPIHESLEDAS
jgi:hypothetical protein